MHLVEKSKERRSQNISEEELNENVHTGHMNINIISVLLVFNWANSVVNNFYINIMIFK